MKLICSLLLFISGLGMIPIDASESSGESLNKITIPDFCKGIKHQLDTAPNKDFRSYMLRMVGASLPDLENLLTKYIEGDLLWIDFFQTKFIDPIYGICVTDKYLYQFSFIPKAHYDRVKDCPVCIRNGEPLSFQIMEKRELPITVLTKMTDELAKKKYYDASLFSYKRKEEERVHFSIFKDDRLKYDVRMDEDFSRIYSGYNKDKPRVLSDKDGNYYDKPDLIALYEILEKEMAPFDFHKTLKSETGHVHYSGNFTPHPEHDKIMKAFKKQKETIFKELNVDEISKGVLDHFERMEKKLELLVDFFHEKDIKDVEYMLLTESGELPSDRCQIVAVDKIYTFEWVIKSYYYKKYYPIDEIDFYKEANFVHYSESKTPSDLLKTIREFNQLKSPNEYLIVKKYSHMSTYILSLYVWKDGRKMRSYMANPGIPAFIIYEPCDYGELLNNLKEVERKVRKLDTVEKKYGWYRI